MKNKYRPPQTITIDDIRQAHNEHSAFMIAAQRGILLDYIDQLEAHIEELEGRDIGMGAGEDT